MTTLAALRRALTGAGAAEFRGDWDVTAEPRPGSDRLLAPAAVLVAISDAPEPMLLLTRRPTTMRSHAGQVAFPGGRIDPGDAGPVEAALREAEEEVDLPRGRVEVLGTLDAYETGSGFSITPVIGIIPSGLVLTPHAAEVAAVFEVPFAHAVDRANHELRHGEWQGKARKYYVIRHDEHEIWGATAGIIVNLARRLG